MEPFSYFFVITVAFVIVATKYFDYKKVAVIQESYNKRKTIQLLVISTTFSVLENLIIYLLNQVLGIDFSLVYYILPWLIFLLPALVSVFFLKSNQNLNENSIKQLLEEQDLRLKSELESQIQGLKNQIKHNINTEKLKEDVRKYISDDTDIYNQMLGHLYLNNFAEVIKIGENSFSSMAYDKVLLLGIAYANQGNYESAIKTFDKFNDADKNWIIWHNIGICYVRLKNYPNAYMAFNKASKLNDTHESTWYNKARSLFDIGRFEESIESYQKALNINKNHLGSLNGIGVSLANLNKNIKALDYFKKAISINPQFTLSWYNKGMSYESLEEYDEAILSYDCALRLDPSYKEALIGKIECLICISKNEDVLECFEILISKFSEDVSSYVKYGNYLCLQNNIFKAIKIYRRGLEIDKGDFDLNYNLGLCYLDVLKYDKAIIYFDRATEINKEDGFPIYKKSEALHKLGKTNLAIQTAEKAIEVDPKLAQFLIQNHIR